MRQASSGSRLLRQRAADQSGQGLTEYALILAFVALVAIVALTFFGTQITSAISSVASSV